MENAREKRAKILFFIVKYANLWGFCCRRRRGRLSSLISTELLTVFESVEKFSKKNNLNKTKREDMITTTY